MKFENTKTPSRRKLALLFGSICLILVFSFSLRYFLAPAEYQTGFRHSRAWFSLSEYIFMTSLVLIVSAFWVTYSRIVVRVDLDLDANQLEVTKIDRFQLWAKKYKVSLSEVNIYIERQDNYTRFFRKIDDFVAVHIEHQKFGDVRIGPQDFPDAIKTIVETFEDIKVRQARHLRQ